MEPRFTTEQRADRLMRRRTGGLVDRRTMFWAFDNMGVAMRDSQRAFWRSFGVRRRPDFSGIGRWLEWTGAAILVLYAVAFAIFLLNHVSIVVR